MQRRDLLRKGGVGALAVASAGGLLWYGTREGLAVEVENRTAERRRVTLSVAAADGDVAHRETFEVASGDTAVRTDVAEPGIYRATLAVGDREHGHKLDRRLCHDPRVTFEIHEGLLIASYAGC